MAKTKEQVFDALDVLNKIGMDYEKFASDCSHCKTLKLGNVQCSCNVEGYCPAYLNDRDINTLTRNLL